MYEQVITSAGWSQKHRALSLKNSNKEGKQKLKNEKTDSYYLRATPSLPKSRTPCLPESKPAFFSPPFFNHTLQQCSPIPPLPSHSPPMLPELPTAAMELGQVLGFTVPAPKESDNSLMKRSNFTQAAASYPSPFLDEQKMLRFSKAAHTQPSGSDFFMPLPFCILHL